MSAILADAMATYREMREEFELYRHAVYVRAHEELREWWKLNGRPTVEEYEAQWWAGRGGILSV